MFQIVGCFKYPWNILSVVVAPLLLSSAELTILIYAITSLPISQSMTIASHRRFVWPPASAAHCRADDDKWLLGCNTASPERHKNPQVSLLMSPIIMSVNCNYYLNKIWVKPFPTRTYTKNRGEIIFFTSTGRLELLESLGNLSTLFHATVS